MIKKSFFIVLFVVVSGMLSSCSKFPDKNNGLSWSKKTSDKMSLNDAKIYCEDLGGRLPTINELKKTIKNCSKGSSCGVTNSCSLASKCFRISCYGCSSPLIDCTKFKTKISQ